MNRLLADEFTAAQVNELDENGMSPLHYAARFNHHQVVRMLVEDGRADPGIRDDEKAIPLHYACRKKQVSQATDREFHKVSIGVDTRGTPRTLSRSGVSVISMDGGWLGGGLGPFEWNLSRHDRECFSFGFSVFFCIGFINLLLLCQYAGS